MLNYMFLVTLSTTENVNLTKKLSDGFKRPIYWNNYETIPAKVTEKEKYIYELLSASFQSVKTLFALAYTMQVLQIMKHVQKTKIIFFQEEILI